MKEENQDIALFIEKTIKLMVNSDPALSKKLVSQEFNCTNEAESNFISKVDIDEIDQERTSFTLKEMLQKILSKQQCNNSCCSFSKDFRDLGSKLLILKF